MLPPGHVRGVSVPRGQVADRIGAAHQVVARIEQRARTGHLPAVEMAGFRHQVVEPPLGSKDDSYANARAETINGL